jgi:hypothetical protein
VTGGQVSLEHELEHILGGRLAGMPYYCNA